MLSLVILLMMLRTRLNKCRYLSTITERCCCCCCGIVSVQKWNDKKQKNTTNLGCISPSSSSHYFTKPHPHYIPHPPTTTPTPTKQSPHTHQTTTTTKQQQQQNKKNVLWRTKTAHPPCIFFSLPLKAKQQTPKKNVHSTNPS